MGFLYVFHVEQKLIVNMKYVSCETLNSNSAKSGLDGRNNKFVNPAEAAIAHKDQMIAWLYQMR